MKRAMTNDFFLESLLRELEQDGRRPVYPHQAPVQLLLHRELPLCSRCVQVVQNALELPGRWKLVHPNPLPQPGREGRVYQPPDHQNKGDVEPDQTTSRGKQGAHDAVANRLVEDQHDSRASPGSRLGKPVSALTTIIPLLPAAALVAKQLPPLASSLSAVRELAQAQGAIHGEGMGRLRARLKTIVRFADLHISPELHKEIVKGRLAPP
mmetsp:Transcript_6334/g.18800  ORF Transcript_6334/g.18800 Transcript_6334/m.18800 type:complete len:210 (+) Transcript_6334:125-754(+)